MDLLYIGLCIGFYLLAIALVAGCRKLGGTYHE